MAKVGKKSTCPENAGAKNMTNIKPSMKCTSDEAEDMKKLVKLMNLRRGKKSDWTKEQFEREVIDCIIYCSENGIVMCPATLQLWLGCGKSQLQAWKTDAKFMQHDTIIDAYAYMENYAQGRLERYPVGNIFRLKAYHGIVETQKVDVTTNGESLNDAAEVKDLVTKLALDK